MLRLSELFSSSTDKITGSGIGSLMLSPVWTSIVLVGVILVIIWFIMHNEIEPKYDDTSFWTLLIKVGVWSIIACVGIQYISFSAIEASISDRYVNKAQREIVHKAINSTDGDGAIAPKT